MTEHICCTCLWHCKDENGDWMCLNPDSEAGGEWTKYEVDKCGEWEARG